MKKWWHRALALVFVLVPYAFKSDTNILFALVVVPFCNVPDWDWQFKSHRNWFFHGGWIGYMAFVYALYSPFNDWLLCAYLLLSLASHLIGDIKSRKAILIWPGKGLSFTSSRIYLAIHGIILIGLAWFAFIQ